LPLQLALKLARLDPVRANPFPTEVEDDTERENDKQLDTPHRLQPDGYSVL